MNLSLIHESPVPTWTVHHSDAVHFLRTLNSSSVDCIITDPAYASLEAHRAVGTTTRLKTWFDVVPNEYFTALYLECWRVLKEGAHLYTLCDQKTLDVIRPAMAAAGLNYIKFLVWDKTTIGMGYHYRSRHELIAFASKGTANAVNDRGVADVLRCPRVFNGYPTEKPVSLLRTLVRQATLPGQLVVDPFMGSGSTGEAAVSIGRIFCGCDLSSKAVNMATVRLHAVEVGK